MKEGILMHFYGTIGPACASAGTLRRLVDAGMTGLRMNLSHGALAEHADWLAMIHAVGIPDLLIDLQGPELRVGRLAARSPCRRAARYSWVQAASPALSSWYRQPAPGSCFCWMTASCWWK